jgi:guanylate kinase
MARNGKFVEWACVHDHYYGTPKDFLEATLRSGTDIILDIDVQGAVKIRRSYPDAVGIFVMTPSMKVLEQRLRARKKDSEEVIRRRLANARKELTCLPKYAYLVINDNVARAADDIKSIILAEHLRIDHRPIPKF